MTVCLREAAVILSYSGLSVQALHLFWASGFSPISLVPIAIGAGPYWLCAQAARKQPSAWPALIAVIAVIGSDVFFAYAVHASSNSTAGFGFFYGWLVNYLLILPVCLRLGARLYAKRSAQQKGA